LASSCGRSKIPEIQGKLPVFPAKGTLLLNGKPQAGVAMVFHPTTPLPKDASQFLPRARTEEDGTFVVSTYGVNDGAPAGKYRITVSFRGHEVNLRNGEEPELMPQSYRNPRVTRLRAEVEEGDNNLATLNIELTPEQASEMAPQQASNETETGS
jgi:hypothetical protein